ncbi:DUF2970 domain-containing protein [Pseudoalteromonas sp. SCSIO 43095]|jgi:DUF2970 family protein|uniref:DUF2970 domain-containing protein n=2 Tax=Pseudoalteromonas TaxID=53246 RepID=A0AB39AR58_9GAMM|nr:MULTISPECIES: DUF2970 domain-containing protein [Pseudoalteromonas]MAY58258.1 DUF2970 domain-containing protein [Pseudoalteromonas sp.]ATC89391.1 hypothetical protein PISS_a0333 [Pseudoalteromonas issachenkonii]EWS98457.1 hypothetical protein BG00_08645 [Pseudoalteromonas sp. SCSIO_11900]MBT2150851.1 DUF2970 domain-containing protein [Pseudoalteromonas tetraodonis]MCK8103193.1 DUF2970 domain-containing protein [Pseudoalteromonas sp. 2CM36K]
MQHFFSALQSVLAAFFGVQSEDKRKTDFKYHSPITLIAIAVVLFVLFVLAIYATVTSVLNT